MPGIIQFFMNNALITAALILIFSVSALTQIPAAVHIQILKAEDARRYDKTLEDLIDHTDEHVRVRAILAAGRIGDEKAIPRLASLLESGSVKVREIAAFALGEIESANAADAILKALKDPKTPAPVRARAVEAAGKIAAANPKDANAKELGEAILDTIDAEDNNGNKQDRQVLLLGLTAALRARPEDGDLVVMKFLTNLDAHVRADAANTLSRLRSKSANPALRAILMSDDDAVARANAARALGAAEDKESLNMLIDAAVEDDDSRVRVSAIRSLASLKDPYAVDKLLDRGEKLLAVFKKSKSAHPSEINELLEVATALGRLVANTNDGRTLKFLQTLRKADKFRSSETEIAVVRVGPEGYAKEITPQNIGYADWHAASAYAQGAAELAKVEKVSLSHQAEQNLTLYVDGMKTGVKPAYQAEITKAMPDLIRAMATFKPENLSKMLRGLLANGDVFIRATAAELLAEQPVSKENADALRNALEYALDNDKQYDDAQLAIIEAFAKVAGRNSISALSLASYAPDYLVRKKAAELLKQFPGWSDTVTNRNKDWLLNTSTVKSYDPKNHTKLGQVLNTDADYRQTLARKNGTVKAILVTQKGTFTINLFPEDAPLTVDNFIKLARSNYFNGVEVHRVVPNFVMQDGDPRGDGNGGPGWSIRCEINMVPFDRGAVGMALSGKDTGGSQWFVTHSPQPHLDGGYTVFGHVNEKDMKVVDNIVRGDRIISVRIAGDLPQRTQKSPRKNR